VGNSDEYLFLLAILEIWRFIAWGGICNHLYMRGGKLGSWSADISTGEKQNQIGRGSGLSIVDRLETGKIGCTAE